MWQTGKCTRPARTRLFFADFLPRVRERDDVDIMIAPPFTSIIDAIDANENDRIIISAQNMHNEQQGAFTGEISASMLVELGCEAVILGHSERRHVFGESDELINKKIIAAIEAGLQPVFCIGEKIDQRESGETENVLRDQVAAGLSGVSAEGMRELIVAYEPVWAIGTGRTATPNEAQEAHVFIRVLLKKLFGDEVADTTRILYGGSVKPSNIAALMAKPRLRSAGQRGSKYLYS